MSSSQRFETAGQHALERTALAPACPVCSTAMAVRPLIHGDDVDGLVWRCRRELVCSGTRRIRDPLVIQPTADSSTHAIFEWERSRDRKGWSGPESGVQATSAGRGRFGRLGRARSRPSVSTTARAATGGRVSAATDSPLKGLIDYGYVVLDDRRVSSARAELDHFVVGPTGIF